MIPRIDTTYIRVVEPGSMLVAIPCLGTKAVPLAMLPAWLIEKYDDRIVRDGQAVSEDGHTLWMTQHDFDVLTTEQEPAADD